MSINNRYMIKLNALRFPNETEMVSPLHDSKSVFTGPKASVKTLNRHQHNPNFRRSSPHSYQATNRRCTCTPVTR